MDNISETLRPQAKGPSAVAAALLATLAALSFVAPSAAMADDADVVSGAAWSVTIPEGIVLKADEGTEKGKPGSYSGSFTVAYSGEIGDGSTLYVTPQTTITLKDSLGWSNNVELSTTETSVGLLTLPKNLGDGFSRSAVKAGGSYTGSVQANLGPGKWSSTWVFEISVVAAEGGDEGGDGGGSETTATDLLKGDVEIGKAVTFGTYEQDNDTNTTSEDISWTVLAVDTENKKALLVSAQALDVKPFNSTSASVTWENCSLRTWLNGDFLGTAFSEGAQAQIVETALETGSSTTDKIFVLSKDEYDTYSAGACTATAYAEAKNSNIVYKSGGNCYWWLRTLGSLSNSAEFVDIDGVVDVYGEDVSRGEIAVRPAFAPAEASRPHRFTIASAACCLPGSPARGNSRARVAGWD